VDAVACKATTDIADSCIAIDPAKHADIIYDEHIAIVAIGGFRKKVGKKA
jgi:hypothetical protein